MYSPGQILDFLVETEVEPEIKIDESKLISLINDHGYTILDIELIIKGTSPVELFQFLAHEQPAHLLEDDALDARIAHLEKILGISDSLLNAGPKSLEITVEILSIQNPILLRELALSYYEKYIKNVAKFYLETPVSDAEIKFLQVKVFATALIAHKASNYQDLISICLACKIYSDANPDTPRTYPKILIDHLDQFAALLEIRTHTSSLNSLLIEVFNGFKNDFSRAAQQKLQLKERLILSQQSTRTISDEKTLLYTANDFVKGYFSFMPDIEQLKNRKLTSRPQSDAYTVLWEFLIAVYKLDLKEYKV